MIQPSSPHGRILTSGEIYDSFENLLTSAVEEIILVSPFIGKRLFVDSLEKIPLSVPVKLVTRWHPHEIAGGFNDLGIWKLLQDRGNCELRLKWNLHAKYYRGDSEVLFGSGNLTNAGLNLRGNGNSEIMLGAGQNLQGIQEFENDLLEASTIPSEEMFEELSAEVERIREEQPTVIVRQPMVGQVFGIQVDGTWKPSSEMPDILFEVYEHRTSAIDVISRDIALNDLEYIQAPEGLSRDEFTTFVRNVLAQSPLFPAALAEVRADRPISIRAGQQLVREAFRGVSELEAVDIWLASSQWLRHFYPNDFQIRHL
jgi:hypothetical protein